MLALVLFVVVVTVVVTLLVKDASRVRHARAIERGLRLVSMRASKRLQFRQPVRGDKDFFVEMSSDTTAAEANGWSGDEAANVAKIFADRKAFANFAPNELVAFERATGTRVGTATFAPSPYGPKGTRSIGIHVHPDHRAKGYGREIMAGAITLMQYEPEPVYVGTRVTNVGLQQIMNQLGFEREQDIRPHVANNGESYDAYWYRCGVETHPPKGLFDVE